MTEVLCHHGYFPESCIYCKELTAKDARIRELEEVIARAGVAKIAEVIRKDRLPGDFDDPASYGPKGGVAMLEKAAKAARVKELEEALKANINLIHRAQDALTGYLVPDGIDSDKAIEILIELLDGPRQREVQRLSYIALKETT